MTLFPSITVHTAWELASNVGLVKVAAVRILVESPSTGPI